MLKKECCKKCWNIVGREIYRWEEVIGWDNEDEKKWKNGYVSCPVFYREKREMIERKITEPPPTKCPFYLEQVI